MKLPHELIFLIKEKIYYNFSETDIKQAIRANRQRLLETALEFKVPAIFSSRNVIEATIAGNLELVKWFYTIAPESNNVTPLYWATHWGHLDIVKWLHRNGCTNACSSYQFDSAIEGGHFEIVQWLYENCTAQVSTAAIDRAIANGRRDIITWLYEHNSGTRATVSVRCMANEIVYKWLKKKYYPHH